MFELLSIFSNLFPLFKCSTNVLVYHLSYISHYHFHTFDICNKESYLSEHIFQGEVVQEELPRVHQSLVFRALNIRNATKIF